MRAFILISVLATLALADGALGQDVQSAPELDPDVVGTELDRLSRELEELRAELEELHSTRFRALRLELDSLRLDLPLPEDFDWPSLEEVRRQWELVPFDTDSLLVWSDSVRRLVRPDSVPWRLSFDTDSLFVWSDSLRWGFGGDTEEMLESPWEWTYGFVSDPPLLLGARRVAGAELSEMNPPLGRYFGTETGVLVTDVTDGSPAADAGLEPGDVITAVDGSAVREIADLRGAASMAAWIRPGRADESPRELRLDVLREGEAIELTLEIGE